MKQPECYRLAPDGGHFDFYLCDSSDPDNLYARVPAVKAPYNYDCYIIKNDDKERIVDLLHPYCSEFPYEKVIPFSEEENQAFASNLLNNFTVVQGYWYKDFNGDCKGINVFLKGHPHYKYEVMICNLTDRQVASMTPLKRIETNYEKILDFWKVTYADGPHDILLRISNQSFLLKGEMFM